jgi:hypothetical protein
VSVRKKTEKVTPETVSAVMAMLGRKGGSASVPKGFSTLTPEQRKQNGIKGAQKRWGKKGKAK